MKWTRVTLVWQLRIKRGISATEEPLRGARDPSYTLGFPAQITCAGAPKTSGCVKQWRFQPSRETEGCRKPRHPLIGPTHRFTLSQALILGSS